MQLEYNAPSQSYVASFLPSLQEARGYCRSVDPFPTSGTAFLTFGRLHYSTMTLQPVQDPLPMFDAPFKFGLGFDSTIETSQLSGLWQKWPEGCSFTLEGQLRTAVQTTKIKKFSYLHGNYVGFCLFDPPVCQGTYSARWCEELPLCPTSVTTDMESNPEDENILRRSMTADDFETE
jgi:hypothetical protein